MICLQAPEASSSEYKSRIYHPLEDHHTIRLLKILPIQSHLPKGSIACTLTHFQPGVLIPPYDTLSYVWGSDKKTHHIYLGNVTDGHEVDTAMPLYKHGLHESLWDFLDQMRKMGKIEGYYWTDYLCLDQANEDEKAPQVARMDEIYAGATRTISWLGRPKASQIDSSQNDCSPKVFPLDSMEQHIDALVKWANQNRHEVDSVFSQIANVAPDWFMGRSHRFVDIFQAQDGRRRNPMGIEQDLWPTKAEMHRLKYASLDQPMSIILKLPYWERVWIVQEVALAQKVVLMFGPKSIGFDDFFMAYKVYIGYANDMAIAHPVAIEARITKGYLDFDRFPEWMGRCKSSKPVDKVYGLLGLLKSKQGPVAFIKHLKVDYGKSASALYWDLMFGCVSSNKVIDLTRLMCSFSKSLALPSAYSIDTLQAYASDSLNSSWHRQMASVSLQAASTVKHFGDRLAESIFLGSGHKMNFINHPGETRKRLQTLLYKGIDIAKMDEHDTLRAIAVGIGLQFGPRPVDSEYDGDWSCVGPKLPCDSDVWFSSPNKKSTNFYYTCSVHHSGSSSQTQPPCYGKPRYLDVRDEMGCLFRFRLVQEPVEKSYTKTTEELSIFFC